VFGMLSEAVKSVASESVEKIAAAAENAVPGQIDDDVAILVIRTSTEDLPTWASRFPAEPIKVSEARRLAFDTFVQCGMDADQAELACLLVSEVVTNVVLHTSSARGTLLGQDFELRIRKGHTSVWVEVFDHDLRLPRIRMASENDEGGRGLYLVDQLAERWGSRPTDWGKAVWFEMPIQSHTANLLSVLSRPEDQDRDRETADGHGEYPTGDTHAQPAAALRHTDGEDDG